MPWLRIRSDGLSALIPFFDQTRENVSPCDHSSVEVIRCALTVEIFGLKIAKSSSIEIIDSISTASFFAYFCNCSSVKIRDNFDVLHNFLLTIRSSFPTCACGLIYPSGLNYRDRSRSPYRNDLMILYVKGHFWDFYVKNFNIRCFFETLLCCDFREIVCGGGSSVSFGLHQKEIRRLLRIDDPDLCGAYFESRQ